jgi:hypothetical protein
MKFLSKDSCFLLKNFIILELLNTYLFAIYDVFIKVLHHDFEKFSGISRLLIEFEFIIITLLRGEHCKIKDLQLSINITEKQSLK